ncbi:type VI secretion system membrane subunit TssM [Erythrobacter sp. JK5]|uniref:type VI secretion system membrane subunit TssM n=1 Tax=Erythrobacter sp. JK5 TaxID=2829500 RepID=UPI001BA93DA7|nr:type VI secretion system membrane subunit TssM [Erythrobacter sp. JK5]QUL36784.1 type VI secretion system membrane subunit TssM [Erythrobacter sp. JK5]
MKKFFTSWWTISIGMILLLILLCSVGLPLFVEWMQPLWVRLTFAGGFVALWLLWFFIRRWRAKKAEAALAKELAGPDPGDEEAAAVQQRMAEALKALRKASGKKRNYLYSLPWYVIIGPPGAGKTTALVNSGLRFPFSDQTLQGTGGTRNLDFMFAEEAVLVDTAGRYTTQDSDRDVDSAGWTRLLQMLKKHRPFEPVNGVFVAIPADDLLRGDVRVIDEHAAIVRRRLREIRETLETELPVYLLITKSDLLAGLTEFFGDLDVDGRRAVVGHTFDWPQRRVSSEDVTSAFDQFANDLAARMPKRLEDEKDMRRRGLILGFPGQVHALRPALHRLVEGAFINEDRPSGVLRGFYLTSGTQDGSAIDRILEGVSQAYSRDDAANREGGKAYFLNRLLTDVAFGEAGLPVSDPALVRKRQIRLTAMVGGIAALSLLAIALWTVSFFGNRDFQNQTEIAAAEIEQERDAMRADLVRVGGSDTPLEQLVPLLDQLRNLPEGYAARQQGSPSLWMRWGLFQWGLSRRNEEAYRTALRRILLPRVFLRLEEKMQQEMNNPVALYEPLKVYLMLGGAAPQGQIDGEAVTEYLGRDWAYEQYPGAEYEGLRTRLGNHLQALVEDPKISQSWAGQRAPLDADLVAASRASVGTMSLAQRAYIIMRAKAADPSKDWMMGDILQPGDAAAFANPEEVMALNVPYFFTLEGFNAYRLQKELIGRDLRDELWVLGEDSETASIQRELGNLDGGIAGAYANEYIEQWQKVIDSLKAADYFNDPRAFSAFTKGVSPLKLVLEEVRKNTTFDNSLEEEGGRMLEERVNRNRFARVATRLGGASNAARGLTADAQIAQHFSEVNAWVGDGEEPGEIDAFIDIVRQTFTRVREAQRSRTSDSPAAAIAQAIAPLEVAALEVPDLVQNFAQKVAEGGESAGDQTLTTQASQYYAETVAPSCEAAVEGKYPFNGSSAADASVGDVRGAFGAGGQVTQFVSARLGPYLDRDGDYWRWNSQDPVTAEFNPAAPGNFQKAAALSSALSEGLPLGIELSDLGAKVSRVELITGGIPLQFDLDGNSTNQIVWQLGGGMVQSSEIKIYENQGIEGLDPIESVIFRDTKKGPWSLFRMFDRARISNLSETEIEAVFNPGPGRAKFVVSFPEDLNPFSGGGLWSVQCPQKL